MLQRTIRSFFIVLILSLISVSCRLTADIEGYLNNSYTDQPQPSDIRFNLIGNMIIMKVSIEGHDSLYNFIFDTGSFTILDKSIAREMEIKPEKYTVIGGAGGGRGFSGMIRLKSVTVGNTRVYDVGAGIIDLSAISEAMGIPVHGIIGNNFFEPFTITWNYKTESFRIDTSHKPPQDGIVFNIRQEISNSNAPRIYAQIDSLKEFEMIFDTGYDGMISLPKKVITSLSYDTTRMIRSIGVMSGGLFGNSPADWLIKPASLKMGPLMMRDVICSSNHLDVGLIGGALMKMTEITISYPDQKLIMRPFDDFQPVISWFGTGLNAVKDGSGNFLITGIWPGSPANISGLKPGDVITFVNGISAKSKHAMWFWYADQDPEVSLFNIKYLRHGSEKGLQLKKGYLLQTILKDE